MGEINHPFGGFIAAMTGHIRTIRPARAAIAAVLAFSATPLFAQTVAPPLVAPTTVPDAPTPAATPMPVAPATTPSPVFKPSAPVVQATPPLEERIAVATAAAEAEQGAQPAARRTAEARPQPRPASRAERMTERAPAPAPQSAPASPPVAAEPVLPAPAPAPVEAATGDPVVTPATTPQSGRTDDALLWALGGGALLLLGLGGAAMMRRRRPEEDYAGPVRALEPSLIPAVAMTPAPARPMVARPAMAPMAAMPADATLEAMVAAPPSADNPFTTRTKRLRRAKFLLAERAMEAAPHVPPQTVHAEPVPASAPLSASDRSQTVYRFGADRQRPGFGKPRTS
jgi:hypothetical protein